jgi:hypothetical protein
MTAFRQVLRRHLLLVACLIGHLHPGFATALLGQTQTVTELKVVASVDPAGQLLGEIEWITRGPSGLVAVSDRGSGQVHFFFPDGRKAGAFGRRGEGPGEFTNMASSGWLGDTLWVADRNRFGVTYIDSKRRTLLRMEKWPARLIGQLPEGVGRASTWSGMPRAIQKDGSLLVAVAERTSMQGDGQVIARQYVLRIGVNGEVSSTLGVTPARNCSPRSGLLTLDNLLCGAAYPVFAPAAGLFATIEDLPSQNADFRRTAVHLRDHLGRSVYSSTLTEQSVEMSQQVRDSLVGWFSTRGPQGAKAASFLRNRKLPLVQRVVVGSDSVIWVLTNTRAGQRWVVLDSRGRIVRTVRPPKGLTIWSVWREGAWGVLEDASGGEAVVRVGWD